MRCAICDYSRFSESEYHDSIAGIHNRYSPKVRWDDRYQNYICSTCDFETKATNYEFGLEIDDKDNEEFEESLEDTLAVSELW